MTKLKVITFLLVIALAEIKAQRPVFVRVVEDRDSGRNYHNAGCAYKDSSEEASDYSHSAQLIEYARRQGPSEDSDSDSESAREQYNISEEQDFGDAEVYDGSDENDDSQHEQSARHPYADDLSDSEPSPPAVSSEETPEPAPKHHRRTHHSSKKHRKPSRKSKKIVYVYKQPPIIVRPKPTNVYIKSKPIVVQPPPLVVHHPEPKPCNPIIKYKPPNINLKPVIVKISKPKRPITTTTTTTTPCPKTTRKPCRKCRTKPSKKCGCRRKHQTVYLNQHKLRPVEQSKLVHFKNMKYDGSVLT